MKTKLRLSKTVFAFGISVCLLVPSQANADVLGDMVNGSNTFQSGSVTGGVETIFQIGTAAVVDPGVELPMFATLYDADFDGSSLNMTLVSNSGLSTTFFGPGVFDRYYFGFDANLIDSVTIAGGDVELTNGLTVGLLNPGFQLNVADLFGTGIPLPREYPNGGFFLEFGEGTDLGVLGRSVSIDFTSTAIPEPSSVIPLGLVSLFAFRRWRLVGSRRAPE